MTPSLRPPISRSKSEEPWGLVSWLSLFPSSLPIIHSSQPTHTLSPVHLPPMQATPACYNKIVLFFKAHNGELVNLCKGGKRVGRIYIRLMEAVSRSCRVNGKNASWVNTWSWLVIPPESPLNYSGWWGTCHCSLIKYLFTPYHRHCHEDTVTKSLLHWADFLVGGQQWVDKRTLCKKIVVFLKAKVNSFQRCLGKCTEDRCSWCRWSWDNCKQMGEKLIKI